ncbi:MAG: amino acid ABC transporter substrate-binding protein [Termitinemataceae bacterium]|nr:MAG: amino acid ABC transporter substrate-binding protein [Termitinemataceae bacterium]
MKKFSVWLAAAALVVCVLLAASCKKKEADVNSLGSAGTDDASLQKVLDAGRFVLGLDDSFPPMGFHEEGTNEIAGYDIDLAREMAQRMGGTLVTQPIEWDSKEQELNTGKIDCIWNGFSITEERKKAVLYTPPYLRNAQVVVVKENSPVTTLADLAGKKVSTQMGSSSIDALDEAPDFKASLKQIIEAKNFLTAFMDLDAGGVDAVVADLVVADYIIGVTNKPLRKLTETLGEEEFGIAFRLKDAALQAKVWAILNEMAADGTIAQISEKWFREDMSKIGK